MSWINISRFQSAGSVGAVPGSANVGTAFRDDVFFMPPAGRVDLLNDLYSCWSQGHVRNLMRIWHNGKPDSTYYNYNTDQLTWQVGAGDVYAIPKEWGAIPPKCSKAYLVDASGSAWTPAKAAKYSAPAVQQRGYTPAAQQQNPSYSAPYTPIQQQGQTPATSVTPPTTQITTAAQKKAAGTNLLWIVGGLVVISAGLVAWSYRSNLKRVGHITRRSNSFA